MHQLYVDLPASWRTNQKFLYFFRAGKPCFTKKRKNKRNENFLGPNVYACKMTEPVFVWALFNSYENTFRITRILTNKICQKVFNNFLTFFFISEGPIFWQYYGQDGYSL